MGKGDKRTRKGKIVRGTHGKSRLKKGAKSNAPKAVPTGKPVPAGKGRR